ncbi:hypothetical protein Slin15195_G080970 [Septoria linicola]|uniref:Uncharacterized protein n=1 Tax=Septoria linicola TaxID=215465 RepID=A0A9Q9AZA6_9PEZI|nr:hypothetical protein Slin14017_G042180 [Septoria linicola]USW54778.1 hypothetical protein Slin15195_G080970 [Septoria linicola]
MATPTPTLNPADTIISIDSFVTAIEISPTPTPPRVTALRAFVNAYRTQTLTATTRAAAYQAAVLQWGREHTYTMLIAGYLVVPYAVNQAPKLKDICLIS